MMNNGSITVFGEKSILGGCYDKITILGEGVTKGEIYCNSLKVLGELRLLYDISTIDMKIMGEVTAEQRSTVSGALRVLGELEAKEDFSVADIKILGESTFNRNLSFNKADIIGELLVLGNCEGNYFISKGKITIYGLLSADRVDIVPKDNNIVNEIGGSEILIRRTENLKNFHGKVISNLIEGDKIVLEDTECKVVRGHDITILGGCNIGRIEYTGNLTVDVYSKVDEKLCLNN